MISDAPLLPSEIREEEKEDEGEEVVEEEEEEEEEQLPIELDIDLPSLPAEIFT